MHLSAPVVRDSSRIDGTLASLKAVRNFKQTQMQQQQSDTRLIASSSVPSTDSVPSRPSCGGASSSTNFEECNFVSVNKDVLAQLTFCKSRAITATACNFLVGKAATRVTVHTKESPTHLVLDVILAANN
jgi:hypothetical protein